MTAIGTSSEEEYKRILEEKQYAVDLSTVGEITVNKPRFFPSYKLQTIMRYSVVQAITDGMAPVPGSLQIRNLHPRDFAVNIPSHGLDRINKEEWEQQARPSINNCRTFPYPEITKNLEICVYEYGFTTHNDRKVTVLYAFENLSPDETLYVKNIILYRGWNRMKAIDVFSLEGMAQYSYTYPERPLLFKKSDDFSVWFELKEEAAGKRDFIALHGIVCEPLGSS